MVASFSCRRYDSSAGLVPHLHLQREREAWLITIGVLQHEILETFAVGLDRITTQQGVNGDVGDLGDDASSNGGDLELSQLWHLCRTISTSSPLWLCGIAGRGVGYDGGGCHRSCRRYWTPRTLSLVKLPEVLGIRNMSRARAISDLLVVALCRTSSTSSPAERERSTAHDIGECTTWDT